MFLAAVNGFLAVSLGAFGAHGLKHKLSAEMMAVYQTAVQYHFYHALALLMTAILCHQFVNNALFRFSGWCFFAGMVIFSGSLYVLSLSGLRWLGAITPFGGLIFLVGWLCLALGAYRISV